MATSTEEHYRPTEDPMSRYAAHDARPWWDRDRVCPHGDDPDTCDRGACDEF